MLSSVDEGEKTYGNYRKIVFLLGKILLEEDTYSRKRISLQGTDVKAVKHRRVA